MGFMFDKMGEIAWLMNKAGCQISDLEGFVSGLRPLPDAKKAPFLETIEERVIYSEWSVSEDDLFWKSTSPPLMQLPFECHKHLVGTRVSLFQPFLYLAAKMANVEEWLQHYQCGGSLLFLVSKRANLPLAEAKPAIYRYLFGSREGAHAAAIEAAFPWLRDLQEQFETHARDLDSVETTFGTTLGGSLFPGSTFGRYLTQTVKDIVRLGVIHLHMEHDIVPNLILQDGVVTEHPEAVIDTWAKNYGLLVLKS